MKAFFCKSLIAAAPKTKKVGLVPKVNANIIAEEVRGLPVPSPIIIILWVTPQGISTVNNPKIIGVSALEFLLWFLTRR